MAVIERSAALPIRNGAPYLPACLAPVRHYVLLAQAARPVTVRSLDAIQLGTALHARRTLTSFVTYDKRLLDVAMTAGLPADSLA